MKLGELIEIRKGRKPKLVASERAHNYRRLIQIDDLRPESSAKYCPEASDEVVALETDVLMAWDGANAGTSSFGLSGVIGSTLAVLRPTRADVYTPYLGHFLRSREGYLRSRCKGATVPHIDGGVLGGLDVPLPTVPEQRRIATILNNADALRAKRRTALTQLRTITQSIFLDMFGDPTTNPMEFPTTTLASLVRADDTINYGVVQPGDDLDDGIPLVRVGDLRDGRVSHTSLKRIAPSIEAAYKRSRLRGDEILVSCVGTVGIVATADASLKGFNIARAVARIPLAESIERWFVVAYLNTNCVQRYFVNELRTVSQPTLNIKQLSETRVFLPPPELQREFARRMETVENLKAAHLASVAELNTLFGSLQHRAFRGEL